MVDIAKKAAEALKKEGLDTGVINMSTIKPLDEDAILEAATASKLIITAEEHPIIGGLGGAVCEFLSERHPMPVRRIGINDSFGCSGGGGELMEFHGLTADNIINTVRTNLGK
jgi:transketolase